MNNSEEFVLSGQIFSFIIIKTKFRLNDKHQAFVCLADWNLVYQLTKPFSSDGYKLSFI